MNAQIVDGKIDAISDTPFPKNNVVVPDNAVLGGGWDGTTYTAPPGAADAAKAAAKARVIAEIDTLRLALLVEYSATEQMGWPKALAEAIAFDASDDEADAPGLVLQAAIRGETVAARATAILLAAIVTQAIPDIAAGMRGRAGTLIDATDGSPAALETVLALLAGKGAAILAAAKIGDSAAMIAAATGGWV